MEPPARSISTQTNTYTDTHAHTETPGALYGWKEGARSIGNQEKEARQEVNKEKGRRRRNLL